ncbi:MAG: glycosyltransferase family 4 protein [Myxococcales bacterium]|nr:glycosyltransferase family 4 protein [Myxococcales bacterium]
MRTLVVSTTFPQYPGDPRGEFILRHWEQAAHRGTKVRILAPRTAWCHGTLPGPCEVVRFDYAPAKLSTLTGNFGILENIRDRPWRAALVWPLVRGLRNAVRRELDAGGIDRVISHMMLPGGWIVADECVRRGVPFELFGHGTDVDVLLWLPRPLRDRFAALVRHADAVRFPSVEKRSRFERAFGGVVRPERLIIEPMIHCVPDPTPRPARRPRTGPPTILYLGRLIPQKGVDDLFAAALRMRPRPRLEIAGDGPHRRRLQRLARRLGLAARFHGFVHAEAKHALLSGADVLCVPSREVAGLSEGAPLVVREAFAYGVPVVATRVGGIPELEHGDGRMLLVPPGDTAALTDALMLVLGADAGDAPEPRVRVG